MLIAAGVMIYIYHEVIIQTLIYMLIAAGCLAGTAAIVALTVSTIRYQRRRTRRAIAGALAASGEDPDGMVFGVLDHSVPVPGSPETELMERTADTLADEGMELEWDLKNGTLRAKKD
jgi:hypothetical protein